MSAEVRRAFDQVVEAAAERISAAYWALCDARGEAVLDLDPWVEALLAEDIELADQTVWVGSDAEELALDARINPDMVRRRTGLPG